MMGTCLHANRGQKGPLTWRTADVRGQGHRRAGGAAASDILPHPIAVVVQRPILQAVARENGGRPFREFNAGGRQTWPRQRRIMEATQLVCDISRAAFLDPKHCAKWVAIDNIEAHCRRFGEATVADGYQKRQIGVPGSTCVFAKNMPPRPKNGLDALRLDTTSKVVAVDPRCREACHPARPEIGDL